jgi:hypothetical protein
MNFFNFKSIGSFYIMNVHSILEWTINYVRVNYERKKIKEAL